MFKMELEVHGRACLGGWVFFHRVLVQSREEANEMTRGRFVVTPKT